MIKTKSGRKLSNVVVNTLYGINGEMFWLFKLLPLFQALTEIIEKTKTTKFGKSMNYPAASCEVSSGRLFLMKNLGFSNSLFWKPRSKASRNTAIEIPFKYREKEAIPNIDNLIRCFPDEKIRIEHASTKPMIKFLHGKSVKMAFTPQHACKAIP